MSFSLQFPSKCANVRTQARQVRENRCATSCDLPGCRSVPTLTQAREVRSSHTRREFRFYLRVRLKQVESTSDSFERFARGSRSDATGRLPSMLLLKAPERTCRAPKHVFSWRGFSRFSSHSAFSILPETRKYMFVFTQVERRL